MEKAKRFGMSAHFDGMCWPVPSEELNDLEWRLRYNPAKQDALAAASVISAYRQLLMLARRVQITRLVQLRRAEKLPDERARLDNGTANGK